MIFLLSLLAWSYPEIARHGYVSCGTCHVSPAGGGLTTPYGRAISEEVLSTWKAEGEGQFLWGAVNLPQWLMGTARYRSIVLHQDNPAVVKGNFIVMQADVEAAVKWEHWTFTGSMGAEEPTNKKERTIDYVIGRKYYLHYQPKPWLSMRAGRFLPTYGLKTPNHTTAVKRPLGLQDQGEETHNLEVGLFSRNWQGFATVMGGRLDDRELDRERGASMQVSVSPYKHSRLGWSALWGLTDQAARGVTGPYGVFPLVGELFVIGEVALVRNSPRGESTGDSMGWAWHLRPQVEVVRGLHGFLSWDRYRLSNQLGVSQAGNLRQDLGVGIQWFPRPHFELELTWKKRYEPALYGVLTDYAYLLTHFYL